MVNLRSRIAKVRYWREFTRLLAIQENYLMRKLQRILRSQYIAIANSIENGSDGIAVIKRFESQFKSTLNDSYRRIAIIFRPYAMEKLKDSIKGFALMMEQKETAFEFMVRKWIEKNVAEKVVKIQNATKWRIKHILEKGKDEGLSYKEIAQKIRLLDEIESGSRALKIARTEDHGILDFVVDETMKDSGVIETKDWFAALDERTRPAHVEADGQKVEIDEEFFVDGEYLEYPGDPKGSAGNIIYCRCVVLYYSEEAA